MWETKTHLDTFEGSITNSPQTESATWTSSETFQNNKKETRVACLNLHLEDWGSSETQSFKLYLYGQTLWQKLMN